MAAPPDHADSHLLRAFEDLSVLVWRITADGVLLWTNRQWVHFTGLAAEPAKGVDWLEAVHPDDRPSVQLARSQANASGTILTVNCRLRRAGSKDYRWFQNRAVPEPGSGGEVSEWLGSSTDVEELMRQHDEQRVVVAELQHRSRNLLGIVRSVGRQLASTSADMETYRARFEDRLAAMMRVQGLLSRIDGGNISFSEVVEMELRAVGAAAGDRASLIGPHVDLPGHAVQIVALAMHELATNALKHGALRHRGGRLEIHWNVQGEGPGWLHIHWLEHRDPERPWRSSRKRGYGRDLIEKALPYQLGASTDLAITSRGLSCAITLPLR